MNVRTGKVIPMADALFYPNYVPNDDWLRSALLFFDSVHTIVPKEDQNNVRLRTTVKTLLDYDPTTIIFEHPTVKILENAFSYYEYEDLERVVAQIKSETKYPIELERARENNEYRASLVRSGIARHLARQKIPDTLFSMLNNEGLVIELDPLYDPALRVPVSEFPVLTHPRVADFVMARLAEAFARDKRLASLTHRLNDFAYNAFQGVRRRDERTVETDLLATSINLIVPPDIGRLPIDRFAEIRARYEGVREATRDLFATVAREERLDSVPEVTGYADALRDTANLVGRRILQVQRELGEEDQRKAEEFCLVSILTLVGAAVGASVGGPFGAMVGAGIPIIGNQLVARAAASAEHVRVGRGETYRALATLRRDIIEATQIRRVVYPGVVPA